MASVAPNPTISIYQDALHVEGILQQANKALITNYSQGHEAQDSRKRAGDVTGDTSVAAELKVPGVGGVKADAKIGGKDSESAEGSRASTNSVNFRYTSAFYLHQVRYDLRESGRLKQIVSIADVNALGIGDFVEFRASFKPDELIALLDVFNPAAVKAIALLIHRRRVLAQIPAVTNHEERQNLLLQYQIGPEAESDLAMAIAEAVRVDFRSGATREYYGTIEGISGVTAAVVCDTRSFLVEDSDRILDGHFTVLGKVGTLPRADVPILARNKVLDRIQPQAVDFVMEEFKKLARTSIAGNTPQLSTGQTIDNYLDVDFPSRISGLSFNVIPIAIYI